MKLRKIIWTFLAVIFALNMMPLNSYALFDKEGGWLPEKADNMPTFSHSQSFLTKYIWRGWNLGDEPVWQMDSAISWYGLTFDFWTNYTLNDEKGRDVGYQEFTEVDYNVDYTFNVGEMFDLMGSDSHAFFDPISISAGYTYYTFPSVEDSDDKYYDTHEVYLGVAYDCLLQPFFTWYWDVDTGKGNSDGGGNGSYFLFGVGHTFEFEESGIAVNIGMTTGILDEQWTNKSGWGDMVFSGDVNIPIFNYFTITPSVAYSLILDRDVYNDSSENEFYGGITISFEY